MKDMLQVNGEAGSVLFDARIDQEYEALGCAIDWLEPGSPEFKKISAYVIDSQVKSKKIQVRNVFRARRSVEHEQFAENIGNLRLLFHGSRIQNWVGILSRGILLPKIVVSMGIHRTDAGWLGHGIYFGDAACTSIAYASPGKKKTSLLAIANVALGKMKDYHKITYGLSEPPAGFHSCHGVRARTLVNSEFADDEYVVYDVRQQRWNISWRSRPETGPSVTSVLLTREDAMATKIVLVDINPKMIRAWRATFEENPEAEIVQGSMLEQKVDAWVTPTNARASMDGGLDAAIKNHLGQAIEKRVQLEIRRLYGGQLAVGHATCVPTGSTLPGYLISTPTMTGSSENISHTLNVALACAAAFQAVHMQNAREAGQHPVGRLARTGGAIRGKSRLRSADLMWTGYNLFRRSRLRRLRRDAGRPGGRTRRPGALVPDRQEEGADRGPNRRPTSGWPQPSTPAAPSDKKADVDFDDF